ncbi:hypothetical protein GM418_14630 [Maribellus comscasis]|uniref:PhoD-like phosphatase metallophosphatase domain-containing protein n=1 Tax=Maribellus comscasis TaxID=2681766 RepID=A0A6I6JUW6_9BACT|nr:hypothetical protein [Maribellus comscasis]QGY44858.1 hypothetical protein GM418_14630 [Maribellus comscasis]
MPLNKTDILCGPIVRKVAPDEVSVWIALKTAAKVELTVWNGIISFKNNGEIVETPVGSVSQDTTQIGKFLHITVVRLSLSSDKLLQWGQLYSYNLKFTTSDNESRDFKSLNLVDDTDKDGKTTLSYESDQLPGFALPAPKIEDLKIIHGSCRNNDNLFEDALSFVDDIIKKNLADPVNRPQQLFMSGDQIYADSVVGALLGHLTNLGNNLLNDKETLPTNGKTPGTQERWPADANHFPAYIRRRLIDSEARFTTGATANHLISFGEFVGMYLSVWSDVSWPEEIDNLKNFEQAFNEIEETPKNFGAIFKRNLFDERSGKKAVFDDDVMKSCLDFLFGIQNNDILRSILSGKGTLDQRNQAKSSVLSFLDTAATPDEKKQKTEFINYLKEWIGPFYLNRDKDSKIIENKDKDKLKIIRQTLPKVRRMLANISTFMIFDDHDITDDWNLNPSWRDRVFTSPLGKAIVRNGMMAYALFQDWGNRADRYNREGHFFELETVLASEFNTGQFSDTLKSAFSEKGITLDSEKVEIKLLHTDEWLLQTTDNKDEFIIRKYKKNADDDDEILKVLGNPHAHLLNQISLLFKDEAENTTELEEHIDFLFGLDFQHRVQGSAGGRQQLPDNRSPLIKWHFTYEGAKHKILAIDNRTRRSFVKFHGAPGNLSFNGMTDLIPKNPTPKDDDVCFVIAPLPVLGPSVFDELIAPLAYKATDFLEFLSGGEEVKSGMKGTDPDAIEAWAFDPVSQEELLKRLAPFKRIIFLSGDVHYGSSQRLAYWTKGNEKATACFAQLTSSGFRNIMPAFIQKASQNFLNLQKTIRQNLRAERLGWTSHKINPQPIELPDNSKVFFLRHKLKESPVIIPVLGWPKGTKTGRSPDWSWRIENVLDSRKESDRPTVTQVKPLEETDDMMKNLQKIAIRHIEQAKKVNYTRQILFKTNLGLVSFEKSGNDVLHVIHSLYAVPFDGKPGKIQDHDIYTLHKIALEASENEKAPTLPDDKN